MGDVLTRPPLSRCRAGGLVIHLTRDAGQMNGAVGENRTHDLSLTKGLRYHYATTATVVSVPLIGPNP